MLGFFGGYCTKNCSVQADCPADSECGRNISGGQNVCLKDCSSPGQAPGGCRTNYVCDKNPSMTGVPVCFPGCSSNTMCVTAPTCDPRGFCCGTNGYACCSSGSVCDGTSSCASSYCVTTACGNLTQPCCSGSCSQGVCSSGTCVACGTPGHPCCSGNTCTTGTCQAGSCVSASAGQVGDPCTDFSQCAPVPPTCLVQTGNLFVGGYCSMVCSTTITCPSGSECSQYASGVHCLKKCDFDGGAGGCRPSYICERELLSSSPLQGACYPACTTAAECGGGGLQCQAGFCCGNRGYRCCSGNTCPVGGTCGSFGYCQ